MRPLYALPSQSLAIPRPLTITFLSSSSQLGGAERVLLEMLSVLRAHQPGWRLYVVTVGPGPLVDRVTALGVAVIIEPLPGVVARLGEGPMTRGSGSGRRLRPAAVVRRLGMAAWSLLRYVRRLRRLLLEMQPDIVHSNGLKMHLLGARACPPHARLVWHAHDYLANRPLSAWLLRRHAFRCALVLANSASVAGDLAKTCGKRTRVVVVHNTVDLVQFFPTGSVTDLDAVADMAPALHGTVRVGLVGTFARWKGHDVFLKALARLPDDLPYRAFVVGGPIYDADGSSCTFEELKQLARDLGVAHRVGFTGFLPDAASALRALDIVVHASRQPEPFGLVIAEAMACGRAVVVSDAGGAAEIADVGVNALGHAPGDDQMLAARITTLARDAALRHRLGAAAHIAAHQRFSRARLGRELSHIYRGLRPAAE